jgi:hypothetical protein
MQIMLSDTVRLIQYYNICQLIFNIKNYHFPVLVVIVWLIYGSMLFLLKFMHDELIALVVDIAGIASSSSSSIALSLLPVIMNSCL